MAQMTKHDWACDPLGIVQENKILPYYYMIQAQTRILSDFDVQTDHSILA